MNKTALQTISESTIATDIDGLVQILGCGKETARNIAELAEARIATNSRRALYSIEKIKKYISKESY